MANIILYHHVQGLTDGVRSWAEQLQAAGHSVATPDLFDEATFTTIDQGLAHAEQVGFDALLELGTQKAEALPADTVYAGFSLGALIAHKLAQTRPGAKGVLLYSHGDVPVETFGETWPSGVNLQIHVAEKDELVEMDVVEAFVATANQTAKAELFVYPGKNHLFYDWSVPGYEAEDAELAMERSIEFLDALS